MVLPVPPGYTAVTPWVIAPDAAALLAYLADVFGAEEVGRVAGPDGRIGHAETRIGDAVVMTLDAHADWPATPTFLRVHVADLLGVVDRALGAGSTLVTAVTELPGGELGARLTDPWGNLWWVHEVVEEVDVTEMIRRLQDPATLETMTAYEDSLDVEMRRRSG